MKIKIYIASELTLFIAFFLLLHPLSVEASTTVNLFQITTDPTQQKDPLVYKEVVAYDSLGDIWGYDLNTKTNFPILQKPGQQYLTGFYKDFVIYDDFNETTQHYSVNLYNMKTKKDMLIAGEPGSQNDGVTNGNVVAYISGGACGALELYNLKTKNTSQIVSSTCTPLRISGDTIVFDVSDPGGTIVKGYDLDKKTIFTIASGNGFNEVPNVYNDNVVWLNRNGSYNAIMFKNLLSGKVKTLYSSTSAALNYPAVSNNYVVWSQSSAPNIGGVMGANIKTGEVFTVQPQGSQQNSTTIPSIWNNFAAMMSWRTGNGDIYGATFSN